MISVSATLFILSELWDKLGKCWLNGCTVCRLMGLECLQRFCLFAAVLNGSYAMILDGLHITYTRNQTGCN